MICTGDSRYARPTFLPYSSQTVLSEKKNTSRYSDNNRGSAVRRTPSRQTMRLCSAVFVRII